MSSSNCCFLTCIQISQKAGQVVWYSHLCKSFPQFVVIHTLKGFSVVNKAEVYVFLELCCFFSDPMDVGNLISGSSAFSKSSLNIWNFLVHILLKPRLENFWKWYSILASIYPVVLGPPKCLGKVYIWVLFSHTVKRGHWNRLWLNFLLCIWFHGCSRSTWLHSLHRHLKIQWLWCFITRKVLFCSFGLYPRGFLFLLIYIKLITNG